MPKKLREIPKFPERGYRQTREIYGADPELFLFGGDKNQKLTPPSLCILKWANENFHDFLAKGAKTLTKALTAASPYLLYGYISRDGAQLELHPKPSTCRAYFTDSLRGLLYVCNETSRQFNLTLKVSPVVVATATARAEFPRSANVAGCDPDFEAYDMNIRSEPWDMSKHPLRYGAGHIHIGFENPAILHVHARAFVMLFDLLAGLPQVALGLDAKAAKARRKRFGRAGSFRIQPHGLEYRALDNTWLWSPKVFYLLTEGLRLATKLLDSQQEKAAMVIGDYALEAREIINEGDTEAAADLYKSILLCLDEPTGVVDSSYLLSGYENLLTKVVPKINSSVESIVDNWKLNIPREGAKGQMLKEQHAKFCNGGLDELLIA